MYALPESGSEFPARLIAWQQSQGRHDLPWQQTRDAYRIWLSEIMLQQTQVSTVIPYFTRFLKRFPTIEAMAQAPLESVLELWAGLGYYARARNLHRCARIIVADYAGRFPDAPEVLAGLPGIGRSTAAAICVFAFARRAAILDGNVKRVLARCFGIDGAPGLAQTGKTLWALAEALLPAHQIEAYTQGLMDLGATRCVRRNPSCERCPMAVLCIARREGRQHELPVARARKVLPQREACFLLLTDGQQVLLERRPPTGIWGGLLSLPEVDQDSRATVDAFAARQGCRVSALQELPAFVHVFSHFRLNARVLQCTVEVRPTLLGEPRWAWLAYPALAHAALPAPIKAVLSTITLDRRSGAT